MRSRLRYLSAVLFEPTVRISALTCGAKGTRTSDPLLANNRQTVHPRPSPQVTVPERVSASLRIRTCCGTFVLYSPPRSTPVRRLHCATPLGSSSLAERVDPAAVSGVPPDPPELTRDENPACALTALRGSRPTNVQPGDRPDARNSRPSACWRFAGRGLKAAGISGRTRLGGGDAFHPGGFLGIWVEYR
jgi:hypothetical protein